MNAFQPYRPAPESRPMSVEDHRRRILSQPHDMAVLMHRHGQHSRRGSFPDYGMLLEVYHWVYQVVSSPEGIRFQELDLTPNQSTSLDMLRIALWPVRQHVQHLADIEARRRHRSAADNLARAREVAI